MEDLSRRPNEPQRSATHESPIDNPYQPPKPHDDPPRETKPVPPSMPWPEAIRVALLMCVFAIITMFCVVSLGITWGDAKGGASGNLPPVLSTTERVQQSIPAAFVLGLMLLASIRWWKRQRAA
tara:strand:- start:2962 stop:3333 length:372 start_codon:yes stop_codon:yes gene_type:complete